MTDLIRLFTINIYCIFLLVGIVFLSLPLEYNSYNYLPLKPFIMNAGSKILLGVLAGAATGAIIGVLFAPETGTETRRKLGEGSRDLATNLKQKFSDLVDGIADKYENAKEGASDLVDQAKSKASDLASNLKSGGGAASGGTTTGGTGGSTTMGNTYSS
ncbi:MAG: gas vesicle protein [Segetibacter sp.]|nr:gas vesicle protein [Segetibacter sp.]